MHTHSSAPLVRITTPAEFEALPIGTVVRDEGGEIGLRTREDWRWTDPIQDEIGPYGSFVEVLYRPEQAGPR